MLKYFNYEKYNTACFYEKHIFIKTRRIIFFLLGEFFFVLRISCMMSFKNIFYNIFKNINNEIYLCVSFNIIEILSSGKKWQKLFKLIKKL